MYVTVSRSVSQPASQPASQLQPASELQLAGRSVGQSVGQSVGWSVGWSVSRLVSQSASQSVSQNIMIPPVHTHKFLHTCMVTITPHSELGSTNTECFNFLNSMTGFLRMVIHLLMQSHGISEYCLQLIYI